MTKTAILCLHKSNSEIRDSILSHLNDFKVDVLEDNTDDKFEAYYSMAVAKRNLEVSRHKEFDLCIVMSGTGDIYKNFRVDNLPVYNVLYFITGHVGAGTGTQDRISSSRITLSIDTDMFYSDSLVFDRACEYKFHKINTSIFPEKYNTGNDFYFHLKSLYINTECINYEDSSLFVRAT